MILCQVTSKPYGDTRAVLLNDNGFESGSVRVESFVRPGKLFTAHQTLIVSEAGLLKEATFNQIIDAVVTLLKSSTNRKNEAPTSTV